MSKYQMQGVSPRGKIPNQVAPNPNGIWPTDAPFKHQTTFEQMQNSTAQMKAQQQKNENGKAKIHDVNSLERGGSNMSVRDPQQVQANLSSQPLKHYDDSRSEDNEGLNSTDQNGGDSKKNFEKDASNNLSYSKMKYHHNQRHPRIAEKDPMSGQTKYKKHGCCKTSTGWHCICRSLRKNDLNEYGEGIVLYFMFMKYMIMMFFVMSIVSIPAYAFYWSGNASDISSYSNIKYALAAFTLGNIGASQYACNTIGVSESNFTLFCPYGTMETVYEFGSLGSNETTDCQKIDGQIQYTPATCDYNSDSFIQSNRDSLQKAFNQTCLGEVSCNLTLNQNILPSQCKNTVLGGGSNLLSFSYVKYYIRATCRSDTINLKIFGTYNVDKSIVSLVVVFCDIFLSYSFFIAIILLKMFQIVTSHEINSQVVTASEYTVQINSLPNHSSVRELKAALWTWIEHLLEKEQNQEFNPGNGILDENQNSIMNIQFGLEEYGRMKFMLKMADHLKEKKKQEGIMAKNPSKSNECQQKIDDLQYKAKGVLTEMEEYARNHPSQACIAFVQFQSMNGKKKMQKAFKGGCCSSTSKYSHKYIDGIWPAIKSAPEPSVIVWENLSTGACSRFFRSLIIWVLSILLMAVAFVMVIAQRYIQNKSGDQYSIDSCSSDYEVTKDEAYTDYAKFNQSIGLMNCYCFDQFKKTAFNIKDIKFTNATTGQQQALCVDWALFFSLNTAMIYGTAILIAVMNTIIKTIIKFLSKFEKKHTKTQQISSNTLKMFILQLLNTGIIILIVNAKISEVTLPDFFPVFAGSFPDFTVEWYRVVGSTISLTMLINIVTPHIPNLISTMISGCSRCWDRGCTCDKKKTNKLLQEDYEGMYLGPDFLLELRYSQVLSNIFIIMIYSSGMPLLYIVGLITFFLTYWIDKFLFLRVYKKPPRYDRSLAATVTEIIKYSLFLHFAFGFYMYSNSNIFTYHGETFTFLSQVSTFAETYADKVSANQLLNNQYLTKDRFLQTHSLIYILGFAFFVVIYLLQEMLTRMCMSCCWRCCCCISEEDLIKSEVRQFSSNIYKELQVEDLQIEYTKTKTEMQDLRLLVGKAFPDSQVIQLFLQRLDIKLKIIKAQLVQDLKEQGVLGANDTMDGFHKLFARKKDMVQRLRTLYSYDIKDNPDYKKSQKIEKRIRKFYGLAK